MQLSPGHNIFDKYIIQSMIGKGGMGDVYLAHDIGLKRDIAIKFIQPELLFQVTNAIDQFIQEAQTIAQLKHNHILDVYDLDKIQLPSGNYPFLVMPLAANSLQNKLLNSGSLPLDECEKILTQVCSGLDYAHSKNIVHLDLKPGNILLNEQDEALIADFGLAQMLNVNKKAQTGAGTPGFMPPEQWNGTDLGAFSDVYAMGVTLHVLLKGKIPFTGSIANPVIDIAPDLPTSVQAVIRKAIQQNPADRYQSAGALAAAFSHALHPQTAVSLTKITTTTRSPRPVPITTLDPQGQIDLRDAMRELGAHCEANHTINEREVVTYAFKQAGLFACLGYDEPGQDALLEHKNADVVLRAVGGRVVGIVEFKRPSRSAYDGLDQLENRYVVQQLPDVGVLCNGNELLVYRRQGTGLLKPPVLRILLKDATVEDALQLHKWLGKRTLDFAKLDEYEKALNNAQADPLPVRSPEEGGGMAFLNRFALSPHTVFGGLVAEMMTALPGLTRKSDFARGAYNFWRLIYARDLNLSDAPVTWKPFLSNSKKETLYQFMFALESAYAVLSRLLLAQAMSDHNFPNLDIKKALLGSLSSRDRHGQIPLTAYAEGLKALFSYTGNQAFQSVFDSDIFDWWHEVERTNAAPVGEHLAEIVLAVSGFDFKPMTGDLLGALYQEYFDGETRRALGEFYTPPEIVDFILDQVGYTVDNPAIRTSRLLDPAVGSGSFAVRSLQRYLAASQGQKPANTIADLLGGLRVIGFDVNPFAVLMAQINYAAQIIPLYALGLKQDLGEMLPLLKLPIPIMRTDSLRQEYREGEQEVVRVGDSAQLGFRFEQDDNMSIIKTELPVEVSKGKYFEASIPVPRYDKAKKEGWVGSPEEYFKVLPILFDVVRNGDDTAEALEEALITNGFSQYAKELAAFMEPAAKELVKELKHLRDTYNDGRFLKTLSDLALALILKGDIQYDYVVGNPPYIRVRKIPSMIKNRWAKWYQWAEGSFDAYIPFIERAVYITNDPESPQLLEWLKPGGKLGFIIPNRVLLADYAQRLREELPKHADISLIVDLRDSRVFSGALNYPSILILNRLPRVGEQTKQFPVARVFNDPRQGANQLLNEIRGLLEQISTLSYAKGGYADAFWQEKHQLNSSAWLLMPPSEQEVFNKIEDAAKLHSFAQWPTGLAGSKLKVYPYSLRLEDLTLSTSGGFSGYSTSDDPSMLFRLLEDRGNSLLLQPKGAEDNGWVGPIAVEIEKEIVRPWLFGRNIERWDTGWDSWYVFFPYEIITALEHKGGTLVPVTRYRLIPSTATTPTFVKSYHYIEPFSLIDTDFPLAWEYVSSPYIQQRLRRREHNRFEAGKPEEHFWYGASYPRSLDLYFKSKILMQGMSPTNDAAADLEGLFVFSAASAGQSILPNTEVISLNMLTGLLNSAVLDFYLKHISTVYSGKTYSYGDQFIKQFPVRIAAADNPSDQIAAGLIDTYANKLTQKTGHLRIWQSQQEKFPAPQMRHLPTSVDIYPFHQLVIGTPQAQTFHRGKVSFKPAANGTVKMTFGTTSLILPHQPLADVIAGWLRLQSRQTLATDDLMALRLPKDPAPCQHLLAQLASLEQDIQNLQKEIQQLESNLNTAVADYYGLNSKDIDLINDFLNRF